jgi:uncharacterized membrane protein
MKHERLHALADGIFAIAMTLLVLELKVPEIKNATNAELLHSLKDLLPSFYSFVLSFFLLFIYWRAFNAVVGTLAKTINATVVLVSAVFLLLISVVPFSSYFFGRYGSTQVGIGVYVANLVMIGLMMQLLRSYIVKSDQVEITDNWKQRDHRNAMIRVLVPVTSSLLAFAISFWSTQIAGAVLLLNVFFNVFNRSFDPLFKILDKLGIGVDDE